MKTILSGLMALAFILPTAPSFALNSKGLIAAFEIMGEYEFTGYTLVAQCKMGTQAEKTCTKGYQNRLKNGNARHASYIKSYMKDGSFFWCKKTPPSEIVDSATENFECRTPLEHERRRVLWNGFIKKFYDRCMARC